MSLAKISFLVALIKHELICPSFLALLIFLSFPHSPPFLVGRQANRSKPEGGGCPAEENCSVPTAEEVGEGVGGRGHGSKTQPESS